MKLGFTAKTLFAMAALAIGGAAHANTSINETTTGSLILNVVDNTSGLSYVFDTGVVQSTFDQNGFYSFNVSGDANYQAFVGGTAGHEVVYNVISADNQNPGATTEDNALSTIVSIGNTRNSGLNNAMNNASIYADQVNNVASGTSNSAFIASSSDPANWANFRASWEGGLSGVVSGAVGTALQFYSINFNGTNKTATLTSSLKTVLAQTWFFGENGVLTYGTQTAPVPLPAPFALLLGGLAMMGAISRRKSEEKA